MLRWLCWGPAMRGPERCWGQVPGGGSAPAPVTLMGAWGVALLDKRTCWAPAEPAASRSGPVPSRPVPRVWKRRAPPAGAARSPPPPPGGTAQRGRRRRRARHPRDSGANQGAALALPRPGTEGAQGKRDAAAGARGLLAALHGGRELLQRGRLRALLGERRDGAAGSRLR